MYKSFSEIEQLFQSITEDKNCMGANSAVLNRYPLRFVLLEDFSDFNKFIQKCTQYKVLVIGVQKWLTNYSDDQMLTYTQLAESIENLVKCNPDHDYVVTPFSEITRFYDNNEVKEFDSLLKTIRLIEAKEEGQQRHQRIYVPIIGMQGKISNFKNDPNINIWEYCPTRETDNYKLILTRGKTYGVNSLEINYSVCHNIRQWLSLWEKGDRVNKRIICSSTSIFDCAVYAQPDNAFEYIVCNNAYEFLTKGLLLDFGDIPFYEEDLPFWEQMASNVDISSFSFGDFVKKQLSISYLLENEIDFVKALFDNNDSYKRWLIKLFFLFTHKRTYLNLVLADCKNLTISEFLSVLATKIFEVAFNQTYINQRLSAINEAIKYGVQVTESAENKIKDNLERIAKNIETGYHTAMKYMTLLTMSEKVLMVEWLGEGNIVRDDIKKVFPELFYYTAPLGLQLSDENQWINYYFDEYRKSKISHKILPSVVEVLKEKNSSQNSFEEWRNNFSTVKTQLYNKKDIDVFYWIDGLGVDWIPFIRYIVEKNKANGLYLNDIYIAIAELPSTTEINKEKLLEISSKKLTKIGNIDDFAHKQKEYPQYVVEELYKMKEILSSVLGKYNDKKIAFISDHGISYLAGLDNSPLNIGSIKSDHAGRCATWEKGKVQRDNNYVVLEDNKTICSLTYKSLSTKTHEGTGAHGGATPEEILVPIIIVSNNKENRRYIAKLVDSEISAASPIVRYMIKGLGNADSPVVIYNGKEYKIKYVKDNIYESDNINFVGTFNKVELVIGDFTQEDSISIKIGVEEEDLFKDF